MPLEFSMTQYDTYIDFFDNLFEYMGGWDKTQEK